MSLTFLLVWFAMLSFLGSIVWRVPLWVPVGTLCVLEFLKIYPVR
jgi:hypothetical protein